LIDEEVNRNRQKLLLKIKTHVCYIELVYERVNKRLAVQLSKTEVESLVIKVLDNVTISVEKINKIIM